MRRGLAVHTPDPSRPLAARLALFAAALFCASTASPAEHEILTRGNQWSPSVIFIEPGDSLVWTGMTGHETELVADLHPRGVASWRSELNEEGFRATFDLPGAYIYKCHVHLSAGMIGAVVVGSIPPENLAAIDAALAALGEERVFIQRVVARMKREIERRSQR